MGVSTDAYLAWGVDLGEDTEWPEEADGDPSWWAHENLKDVVIETHCSCEYPMYALVTVSTYASRGHAEEISKDFFDIDPEKEQEKLDAACEKLGIEKTKGSWLLFSLWC